MRSRRRLLAAGALAAVLGMAVARAWTCDDAFITFRVVDQLLAGNGPVYNIGERVQVFTHPLWFLALCAWSAAGASLFPGAAVLSLAAFAAGLACVALGFRDKPVAVAAVGCTLALSRTITDFATGGLETPLSFALAAAAVCALRGARPALAVGLLSLLPLNRLDLLPWALPFAWIAFGPGRARWLALAALGVPAAAWAIFSTVYYGTPLPNTALAKLGGGVLAHADSGAAYIVASLITDPGACALLALGLVGAHRVLRARPAMAREDRRLALAGLAAAAIDIGYILWTGGDFMLGRFLLPVLWALVPTVLAAAPLESVEPVPERDAPGRARSHAAPELRFAALALALLGLFHALLGRSALAIDLHVTPEEAQRSPAYAGVVDERRFYLPWFGAYSRHEVVTRPRSRAVSPEPKRLAQLGFAGYRESLEQRIIDAYALLDPLLGRVAPLPYGRTGHATRPQLAEFWRWREPAYAFEDPRVEAIAERLRLAHLDPDLWSVRRWRAIAWLLGHRSVQLPGLGLADEGAQWRLDVDPKGLIAGDLDFEAYQVWLRLYDPRVRRYERASAVGAFYDEALDADCRVRRVTQELNRFATIPVAKGQTLTIHCPKDVVRDGIVMRVGASRHFAGEEQRAFMGVVTVLRPPLRWWIDSVPEWLADGWRTPPWGPLAVALALFAGGGALAARARGGRGTAPVGGV